MARLNYWPEMGDKKPEAVGRVSLGHYGKHYYVDTKLELKGRGVEFLKTLVAEDLVPSAQHRVGEHSYRMTILAFKKVSAKYDFSNEVLLD